MKWGMKKSSSSPSPSQIITHVLPVSWFSKFKQKGGSPETVPEKKAQQRRKRDLPSSRRRVARFYGDSDDAYLTLSFRKETRTEDSSTGGANPIWYDSDDEFKLPGSSFKSFGLRGMEAPTREVRKQFKKRDDNGPVEPGKIDQSRGSHSRKTEQNRGKAYSVKKESKIKVLGDKKKARTKIKNEEAEDRRTVFDSCAVVKCSFNPQQDFRDSMVEMIIEKRIKRPAELEELLASYLMLNSDVYQKLIIKVFQQVWLELNRDDLIDSKKK